jgi:hypothetical protein
VKVTVTLPTTPDGPIGGEADAFTVRTASSTKDYIEWRLVQKGGKKRGTKFRAFAMRILTQDGVWPFDGTNPGWGTLITTGPRLPVPVAYTLPYVIEVQFTDDFGDDRTLSIDPDMVIEA